MKRVKSLYLSAVVAAVVAFSAPHAYAQSTQTNLVYETSYTIQMNNLPSWISSTLGSLGAAGVGDATAEFIIYDTQWVATGQVVRTVNAQVYMLVGGVPIVLYDYSIAYDWDTGEVVSSNTNGIGPWTWNWGDEYFLWGFSTNLWGADLDLNIYWGWYVDLTVNVFDAALEGAGYIRSTLDVAVDVGALLVGISNIASVYVDFEAKPIQLRAVLLLNALQGLYTKLYYDLPMSLKVDVDLLFGLVGFTAYEKDWDYSWTLLDKHIVEWLEPDF
jgi:hypothetical protein